MSYSSLGTQMHICIYSILIRLYIYMFLYLYIYVYIDTVQTNVETRGKRMDKRKALYFSRFLGSPKSSIRMCGAGSLFFSSNYFTWGFNATLLTLCNAMIESNSEWSYVAILAKINMRYFTARGIFSSNDLSKFIYHHFPKI